MIGNEKLPTNGHIIQDDEDVENGYIPKDYEEEEYKKLLDNKKRYHLTSTYCPDYIDRLQKLNLLNNGIDRFTLERRTTVICSRHWSFLELRKRIFVHGSSDNLKIAMDKLRFLYKYFNHERNIYLHRGTHCIHSTVIENDQIIRKQEILTKRLDEICIRHILWEKAVENA